MLPQQDGRRDEHRDATQGLSPQSNNMRRMTRKCTTPGRRLNSRLGLRRTHSDCEAVLMRRMTRAGLLVAIAVLPVAVHTQAPPCTPIGKIQFICDVRGPEDLALVPGSPWVMVSGNQAGLGQIRALHPGDKKVVPLYPMASVKSQLRRESVSWLPGPSRHQRSDREEDDRSFTASISGPDRDRRIGCLPSTTAPANRSKPSTSIHGPVRRR